MSVSVTLPYPPSVLSPNNRSCWQKRARYFKKYKADCLLLLSQVRRDFSGRENYLITFQVPDKRRRDLDNMIASFKAGIDALAAVSGVDDSKFQLTFAKQGAAKGGAVIVEAA